MPKPSTRSARSKQTKALRYVAGSNLSTAASELGLSTKQLTRFLNASPETISKSPKRFSHALALQPTVTAKEHGRKLPTRLYGERLSRAYRLKNIPEYTSKKGRKVKVDTAQLNRSIRYTQAVRTTKKVDGKYIPLESDRATFAREQIMNGIAGENMASIRSKWIAGVITRDEAISMSSRLFHNSGAKFTARDEVKYFSY